MTRGNSRRATWVGPQAERPRFPGPLLRRLKPYSQKTSQSNHTRTTTLSNSMKLSHAHGATQDRRVMVESLNS